MLPALTRVLSRRPAILAADSALAAGAGLAAGLPGLAWGGLAASALPLLALAAAAATGAVFAAFGVPRDSWRHGGTVEMARAAAAGALAALAAGLGLALLRPGAAPPATLALLLALLPATALAARGLYRLAVLGAARPDPEARPVLLAGAGDQAELLLRALARGNAARWRVVGVVTVDRSMVGQRLHGVTVLGTLDETEAVLDRLAGTADAPSAIALAARSASGLALAGLREVAEARGLALY